MASSGFWERLSASLQSGREWESPAVEEFPSHTRRGPMAVWMLADGVTILAAATAAVFYRLHTVSLAGANSFWTEAVSPRHPLSIPLALICGFMLAVITSSRRMHLYEPLRLGSFFREQRLSAQACLSSGLLLTGALYLMHAPDVPRSIVLPAQWSTARSSAARRARASGRARR